MTNSVVEILKALVARLPTTEGRNHCFLIDPETGLPTFHFWIGDRCHSSSIDTEEELRDLDAGTYIEELESYISSVELKDGDEDVSN